MNLSGLADMAIGPKRHLMHAFDSVLFAASFAAAFAWAALSLYVLTIERRRTSARATLANATAALARDDVRGLPVDARMAHVAQPERSVPVKSLDIGNRSPVSS